MESSGIYSLNRKSVLNGGSTVSRLNRYVIDVDAVAIFIITTTATNLMTVSGGETDPTSCYPTNLPSTRLLSFKSLIYSLVRKRNHFNHRKKNLISFHINAI